MSLSYASLETDMQVRGGPADRPWRPDINWIPAQHSHAGYGCIARQVVNGESFLISHPVGQNKKLPGLPRAVRVGYQLPGQYTHNNRRSPQRSLAWRTLQTSAGLGVCVWL